MYCNLVLVGRLGAEPEVIATKGEDLTVLSVATDRSVKDSNAESGWAQVTEWHRVKLFGDSMAKRLAKVHKGDLVLIEGSLLYEHWTSDEGEKKSRAVIHASGLKLLRPAPEKK